MFCSNCGYRIDNAVAFCPNCGQQINSYPNNVVPTKNKQKSKGGLKAIIIPLTCVIVFFFLSFLLSLNRSNKSHSSYSTYNNYGYNDYDYNYSNSYNNSKTDASSIFNNLDIYDFSCSLGTYSGTMRCRVKNNNSFTIHGYFYVNFYDSSGHLMYSQLMSLSPMASGETVTCETSIPKHDYPNNYSKVDFSQSTLVKVK